MVALYFMRYNFCRVHKTLSRHACNGSRHYRSRLGNRRTVAAHLQVTVSATSSMSALYSSLDSLSGPEPRLRPYLSKSTQSSQGMETGSTVQARGIYRRASSGNPHPSREGIQRTRAMGVTGAVHFNRDWVFDLWSCRDAPLPKQSVRTHC